MRRVINGDEDGEKDGDTLQGTETIISKLPKRKAPASGIEAGASIVASGGCFKQSSRWPVLRAQCAPGGACAASRRSLRRVIA
jgi:hypothetical protein